jgi:hypothetical protein
MFISFNRTALVAVAIGLIAPIPALAFHFGLGNAAAAEGAKVVNKANSQYMAEGDLVVPALPSCGSNMALFTSPPVTDPTFVNFAPLGHIFPPGHTFPALTSTLMPLPPNSWGSTSMLPVMGGSPKSQPYMGPETRQMAMSSLSLSAPK